MASKRYRAITSIRLYGNRDCRRDHRGLRVSIGHPGAGLVYGFVAFGGDRGARHPGKRTTQRSSSCRLRSTGSASSPGCCSGRSGWPRPMVVATGTRRDDPGDDRHRGPEGLFITMIPLRFMAGDRHGLESSCLGPNLRIVTFLWWQLLLKPGPAYMAAFEPRTSGSSRHARVVHADHRRVGVVFPVRPTDRSAG